MFFFILLCNSLGMFTFYHGFLTFLEIFMCYVYSFISLKIEFCMQFVKLVEDYSYFSGVMFMIFMCMNMIS